MKVARTFTIDHDLVVELQKIPNQSKTVCMALRNYMQDNGDLSLRDASTIRIIKELSTRQELDNVMRKMCEFILANGL